MYQFESAAHEAAFRAALNSGAVQHISGRLFDKSGTEIPVDEDTIVDTPSIDSRCIEDEEVFNIGDMYVGEMNIRIQNDNVRTQALIGGEITLEFGVETETLGTITVPLGVWDIADAKRDSAHFINIVGHDHMGRLAVSLGIDDVGAITLSTILTRIEERAGVIFAQSAADILALAVNDLLRPVHFLVTGNCTHFEETCWEEVRLIAQLIGGFAYADREGRITFRRFSASPDLTITADRRFRAELSEGIFIVKGISYTDGADHGHISYSTMGGYDRASIVCLPCNKYIWPIDEDDECYEAIAMSFVEILSFRIIPGSVDFYGDPSLDLGDMVLISNGIGGSDAKFLVCGSYWQFRAPQTIICGGAPSIGEMVTPSSSAGAGATVIPIDGGVTKNVNVADLHVYTGALFPSFRTAARTRFSCKENTTAFLECSLMLTGTCTSEIAAEVYLDDAKQQIAPKTTVYKGWNSTLTFVTEMPVQSGMHSLHITASGVSELIDVSGCVWGQNIRVENLEYDPDYTYTVSGDEATVTGYTGEYLQLEIPEKLGGKTVTKIDGSAFTDTEITTVYIPEGIVTIE